MTGKVVLVLGFLFATLGTASGDEPPCVFPRADRVNAHVSARVTPSGMYLDYHYMLENRAPASQRLVKFAVEAFSADRTPVVQTSPREWEGGGRIANSVFHVWNTFRRPRGLAAGMSTTDFGFTRAGLPAIVTFLAWGDVKPPKFAEGEAPSSCENADIIENSFKGRTVGPKPPPDDLVPIEFLNYLITLLHDSRQQGWVKGDGVHQSLLEKLIGAKRQLEAGDTPMAKTILNDFLNEVRATSCPTFACPGTTLLTSEAHALLFFNGQYLRERLP